MYAMSSKREDAMHMREVLCLIGLQCLLTVTVLRLPKPATQRCTQIAFGCRCGVDRIMAIGVGLGCFRIQDSCTRLGL